MVTGLPWHLQWKPHCIQTHRLWLFARGIRGGVGRLLDVPPRENAKQLLRATGLEGPARELFQRVARR